MVRLEELDLSFNKIGGSGAKGLAEAFGFLQDMTSLNIGDNDLGPAGMLEISAALQSMTRMKHFNIRSPSNHSSLTLNPSAVQF
mmetsp:Transcript_37729/g.100207  ORF Transcript_37729/g.100207 Transcript_37729/m.100207 type:complete len:84 (-) Transcript_37729:401-652(-)